MTKKSALPFAGLCLIMLAVFACASGGGGSGGTGAKAGEMPYIEADIEVFPQTGHGMKVNSVDFSPDGKSIVSCSGDSTIKLWDIATGREIRTFSGGDSSNAVYSVSFSPDGKYILSATPNIIKLWDVATGMEIKTFSGLSRGSSSTSYYAVKFSPDGKKFISCYSSGIILWDVATGKEIQTLSDGRFGLYEPRFVSFSPDGKYIASGSGTDEKTVKLWDIDTGLVTRTFTGHTLGVGVVAFSPDGRQILSGSNDRTVKLWDVATGREIRTFSGYASSITSVSFSSDGKYALSGFYGKTIKIWDTATGQEIRDFSGHTQINAGNDVSSINFSPDGKLVLSGSSISGFIIWEFATGREIISFSHDESSYSQHGFATFSPDGKYIASGSRSRPDGLLLNAVTGDGSVVLWDAVTGQEIKTYYGNTVRRVNCIAYSPDGKYIASGSSDKTVKLWDIITGREVRTFSGHADFINKVCFSPDGKFIASGSEDETVKLWETATGQEIRTFRYNNSIVSVEFSPDGTQLLITAYRDIRLWDVATGRVIRTFSYDFDTSSAGITPPCFSPDGKIILAGKENVIRLWDVATGQVIRNFSVEGGRSGGPRFSPDGNIIFTDTSFENDNNLRLCDIATGRKIRTFSGHTSMVFSVAFSLDGKYLVSGSRDNTVILWDFSTGQKIRTLSGHLNSVNSVAFSPDGKYVSSGSYDSTTRLWDVSTGNEIAQFISFSGNDSQLASATRGLTVETQTAATSNDGEWLSITPDGYYQASPRGDRYLNVRVNNTVSGIDSYRSVFYNPDVVQARLAGRPDPASKANVTIQQAATFTPPRVTIQSPVNFSTTNTATANLSVSIVDQNQPLQNIKILVNGRLVGRNELSAIQGSRGLQPQRASLTVTGNQKTVNFNLPVSLDPGQNIIEVVAFNGYSESPRIPVEVTWNAPAGQRPALPNLWILAVGVNNYNDSTIRNLNFCVADAKGVVDSLKAQEGRRYAKVNSLLIADGEALAPTAANIRQNLNFLDQAGERDVVLLFLAGHGVSDNAGKFLFLPNDTRMNRDNTVAEASAITDSDIVRVLDRAGNLLVFIDACQSGGVDNDRLVRSLMDTNAFVFASSRGNELSQERPDLGHGVFTYSVMDGLKGAVAAQAQGNVTVLSLSGFVAQDVTRRTGGAQNPKAYSLGFYDFPMAVVR